jgi:SprT protein
MFKASQANLAKCVTAMDGYFAKATQLYGIAMPKVRLVADINSARLGGQANYTNMRLRVNPVFLENDTDHYIEQTIGHEVAHFVVRAREKAGHYGTGMFKRVRSHGPEWQRVMRDLGLPANRTHNYQVPAHLVGKVGKSKARYRYICPNCKHEYQLSSVLHNRIQQLRQVRWHPRCGRTLGQIVYQPVAPVAAPAVPTLQVIQATVKVKAPAPGTKLADCYKLYKSLPGATRQSLIQMFVQNLGMTANGASTYYYQCNKLKEAGV